MRPAPGQIHEPQLVVVELLGGLAVGHRHAKDFAAAVARGIDPINRGSVGRPIDLAAEPRLGPRLFRDVPHARLALRAAQRDGDELSVGRELRLLQIDALEIGARAVDDDGLLSRAELGAQDLAASHEDDLVGADPTAPARAIDDLHDFRPVGFHREDVPLLAHVRVSLAHPAGFASAEEDFRTVGGETREPVDLVPFGDLLHVGAVGVHREKVVVAEPRARPHDRARDLAADGFHLRRFGVVDRILRTLGGRSGDRGARGRRENREGEANTLHVFELHRGLLVRAESRAPSFDSTGKQRANPSRTPIGR
jgi:hypothetical protein